MTTSDDLNLSLMYPSKYLKAEDLRGHTVTVTIEHVNIEALMMTGGRKEKKVVIRFVGKEKQFVANKTNGFALGLLLGPHARSWEGKKVQLAPDVDTLGKDEVPCIRVVGS